ncbi:hypothetical protein PG999_004078 [Apiospora kogelbergensis]|uniref:Uncharacterized protein n=1 Tax=Apiospora kogelbergensis TaxID=1337665 RepID=A0AAW0R5A5_9PEZI
MATHYLRIKNRSNHSQTFQCHGYNGDKNLTIAANQQANIAAKDGTSGAIIAVHDGVIGEQCEITKAGWQGNDTIDISNIVGAGGNMTCQQACNKAWKGLSQQKRDQLKGHVTLDSKGNVKRIGPPKEFQPLEQFVRTFANGRTYIGVGSWAGGKGNPADDKQSSAGKGSKDILIVYSDGNAAPDPNKPYTGQTLMAQGFAAASVEGEHHNDQAPLQEAEAEADAEDAASSSTPATSVTDAPAPSEAAEETLTNKSGKKHRYYFYDNYWNGDGTAGANFDHPLKNVEVGANATVFVPLDVKFKGRVQRGDQIPCTWGEFQVKASNDGKAHGDISLQQGCDGAATVASTDGSKVSNGFTQDIVKGAPAAALDKKPNGEKVLASTEGNWIHPKGNQAAVDYEYKVLGHGKAYIKGGTGVPDVASKNNCLHFTFYVVN